jgi:hypothetical protein
MSRGACTRTRSTRTADLSVRTRSASTLPSIAPCPPVAQDQLQLTADGQMQLRLAHRWVDGTTHLRFDPLELLERLAVLIPGPSINLILYHGVLAPRSALRSRVVGHERTGVGVEIGAGAREVSRCTPVQGEHGQATSRGRARLWADLMRRPRCSPCRSRSRGKAKAYGRSPGSAGVAVAV